jgi:Tol biopolymer transport system component
MVLGPDLSPDGNSIAYFAAARSGGMQIFTLRLSGGTPTQVTSNPLVVHAIPRWSADGQALYFYLTDKTAAYSKVGAPRIAAAP